MARLHRQTLRSSKAVEMLKHPITTGSFEASNTASCNLTRSIFSIASILVTIGFLVGNLRIMAKPSVYGTSLSIYVRIIRLLLEEAGADYHLKGFASITAQTPKLRVWWDHHKKVCA